MIHSFRTHRRAIAASALLLAMVFILTSFSITGSDAETQTVQQGDFQYTLFEDRTAMVNDYLGSASEVTISNKITYGGTSYTVTSVSINAFYGCYTVKKVTLPSTLQSIGESAFHNCVNLETITISSSNQYFKVVDGVLFSKDGSVLYAYPAMKTVTDYYLPDGVERIGNFAFSHVRSLRILVMNEGLESIGRSITSCPGLEVTHIPSTVSSIEVPFADSCLSLTTVFVNMYNQHYRSVDGVLFTADMSTLIRFPASHSTSYVVPEGVKVLAHSSMDHNHLESLILPSTLEEIGRASFYISDLTSIVIPESVKSIGWFAFGYTYISEITFMGVPSYIEDRLFISVHVDTVTEYYAKVKVPLEEHVPDGVTVEYVDIGSGEDPGHLDLYDVTIGDLTYDLSSDGTAEVSGLHNSIGSVIIPGTVRYLDQDYTVTRIGNEAFMDSSITSVSIPDTVTIIGALAFQYCESLKTVDMGPGVEYIGDSAFNTCRSLKSFPLPDSLNEIIGNPFAGCISIDRFTISDSNRYFKTIDGVLFSEDGTRLIAYPAGSKATTYTVPDDVTVLGRMSFALAQLSEITLNDGLSAMEEGCFYTDAEMDILEIPYSVTSIGPFMILGLKEVRVSAGNMHYRSVDGALYTSDMEELVFMPNKGEGDYIIPEGVRIIGTVSMSAASFSSVTLPSTLDIIDSFAFQYSQVEKVIVPDSSVIIGTGVFFHCDLRDIVLLGSPESIGDYAFQTYQDSLTEHYIDVKVPLEKYVSKGTEITYQKYVPGSIAEGERFTIGDLVYRVCSDGSYYAEVCSFIEGNNRITIPASVTYRDVELPVLSIGDNVFQHSSINRVDLPSGLLRIGDHAFYQCNSLSGTLTIPDSVEYVGEEAFFNVWCMNIHIGKGLKEIGDGAFATCGSYVYSDDAGFTVDPDNRYFAVTSSPYTPGLLISKDGTILYAANKSMSGELIIPKTAKVIAPKAFHRCNGFMGTVEIPSSVTSIGNMAFSCCGGSEFKVESGNRYYKSIDGMLISYDGKQLIACPAEYDGPVTIPNGVVEVCDGAFYVNRYVSGTVSLPSSVRIVGERAFFGSYFDSIILNDGLQTIGQFAFAISGSEQGSMVIPGSVEEIHELAFEGIGLTDLTIIGSPDILWGAFINNPLKTISFRSDMTYDLSEAFGDLSHPGYSFTGFFSDSDFTKPFSFSDGVSAGTVVYVGWELRNCTVIYDVADGVNDPSNPTSYDATMGSILLKSPSRAGYEFKGWYVEDETGHYRVFKLTPQLFNSSDTVVLKAEWSESTATYVTVMFTVDGYPFASISLQAGDTITSVPEIPVKGGFLPGYWSQNGIDKFDFSTPIQSDIVLAAVYEPEPVTGLIAGLAIIGDNAVVVVTNADGGKIPIGSKVTVTFTALQSAFVFGQQIMKPVPVTFEETFDRDFGYVCTIQYPLANVIGDNLSIISVSASSNGTNFGIMVVNYAR